jgi:hypothetical protein
VNANDAIGFREGKNRVMCNGIVMSSLLGTIVFSKYYVESSLLDSLSPSPYDQTV